MDISTCMKEHQPQVPIQFDLIIQPNTQPIRSFIFHETIYSLECGEAISLVLTENDNK